MALSNLSKLLVIATLVVFIMLAVAAVSAKSNSNSNSNSNSHSDSESDSRSDSQSAVEDADNGGDWSTEEERDSNLVDLWKCYQTKIGQWRSSDNNRDWVAWIEAGSWRTNLGFRIWKALKFGRNWNCEVSDNSESQEEQDDDIDNGCSWETPDDAKWNLWNLFRCWK